MGASSVDDLTLAVKGNKIKLITIGDAKEPRKITDAVREGFDEALNV
jgi:hypothetical protein